jgi:hypothetical protein
MGTEGKSPVQIIPAMSYCFKYKACDIRGYNLLFQVILSLEHLKSTEPRDYRRLYRIGMMPYSRKCPDLLFIVGQF